MTNLYSTLADRFFVRLDAPFLRLVDAGAGVDGGTIATERVVTYQDIERRSACMARVLLESGVQPGDRVLTQIDKSADNVALYLACLRVGAVYLPVNTAYTTAEVEYFVGDATPRLVVARPGTLTDLETAVLHLGVDGDGSFAEATDAAAPLAAIVERAPDDIAAMLYTSGTTGRSKGAMLTHANLESNAIALHDIWRFRPGDVLLHALPIFHVHGLFVALHCAMLGGNEVIFLPKFDVDTVLARLPDATAMMAVPTHYTRLLDDDRFGAATCSSIRLFTSGSAPMTAAVHREFSDRTGIEILERYGMTEAGMITSNPYDGDRRPGTVGFALPGVDMRICDDDGAPVPSGSTGVVEIRSAGLFAGYWNMADKTAAAYRPDGWFITGDVGAIDDEGRLTLEGRTSDMIISGGLNIYPKEIEMLLDEVPGVLETGVVGVPHPDFGEAVVAIVVRDGTSDLSDDELVAAMSAALDGELARFKQPKTYVFATDLPRNAMAKVQKAALRSAHAALFATDAQPGEA